MRWPPIVPVMASTSSCWWRPPCPLPVQLELLPIHRRSNKSWVKPGCCWNKRERSKRMIIDYHTHYLAREHFHMHARTPDGRIVGASMRGEGQDAILEANGNPMGTSCNPADFYNLSARLERMKQSGVD